MQSQVQHLLTGLTESSDARTDPQPPTPPAGWSIVGPAQPSASHQRIAFPAGDSGAGSLAPQASQQAAAPTTFRAASGVPVEAAQPPLLPQPSMSAPARLVDQGTLQCEPPAGRLTSDTLSIDPVALRSEAAAIEVVAGKATSTQPPAQPSAGDASVKAPEAACRSQPAAPPVSLEACGGLGCSSGTISIDIVGLRSQAPAVCSSTTISVDIVGLGSQLPAQLPAPRALGANADHPPAESTIQQADMQRKDTPLAGSQRVAAEATAQVASAASPAGHDYAAPGQCQAAEGHQAQRAASAPLPSKTLAHSSRRRGGASPAASKRRADSAPLTLPQVSKCKSVGEPQELLAPASQSAAAVAPTAEAGAETVYASALSTVSASVVASAADPAGMTPGSPRSAAHAAHGATAAAAAADAEAAAAALPAFRLGRDGCGAHQHAALQTQSPEETHSVREAQHTTGTSQKRRPGKEDEGSRKIARLEKTLKQINANALSLLSCSGGRPLQTAVTRQQSRKSKPGRVLRGRQIPCKAAASASPGGVPNALPEVKVLLELAAAHVRPERSCAGSVSASMGCKGRVGGRGEVSGQPAQPGIVKEQHALPEKPPAEGSGLPQMPVATAAVQAGPTQHAQQARPAVKPIRGSRELNTLLQAAAALPMRSASAAPLCGLAAGRTRARPEVQPAAACALPCTSADGAPEPPRPKLAKGSRELKALSMDVPSSAAPAGPWDSGRAHPRSKHMRGIRELLALRLDAPSSACMVHSAKRFELQPVRGLAGVRARHADVSSIDRTSWQQSVPQMLEPELASAARISTCSSSHVTAPCTRKPSAESGKKDGRRGPATGSAGGGRHEDRKAHRMPSNELPIARRTRARERLPLLRASESSKRLTSASNTPAQRQLQRAAPSGKQLTAAPKRMHNVLQGLRCPLLIGVFHRQDCDMIL